jgi:hypothetical protein
MQGYDARTRSAFEVRLGPLGPKLDVQLSSYHLLLWRTRLPRPILGGCTFYGTAFTLHINDKE